MRKTLISIAILAVAPVWSCVALSDLALGQDYNGQLTERPLPASAPEVRAFERLRSAGPRAATAQQIGDLPEELFFAAIDPSAASAGQSDFARSIGLRSTRSAGAIAADRTVFDAENMTWFDTEYGAPLNVSLFCSWRRDPDLAARRLADELEDDLEASLSGSKNANRAAVGIGNAAGAGTGLRSLATDDRRRLIELAADDPHHEDEEAEFVFQFAGSTCTLTYRCTSGDEDERCNEGYLQRVSQLLQVKNRGNR